MKAPMAPEGFDRPTKWPTSKLMAKNSITSRAPSRALSAPTAPATRADTAMISTAAAPLATTEARRIFSQGDRVGPDATMAPPAAAVPSWRDARIGLSVSVAGEVSWPEPAGIILHEIELGGDSGPAVTQ